jgi:plasmid stabilization system protein ParE
LRSRRKPSATQKKFLIGCYPSAREKTGIRWFLAMEDAIASLSAFPKRCLLAPENTQFPFEVRQLLYGNKPHVYRILFTIADDTVNILHIRHARRKPLAGH